MGCLDEFAWIEGRLVGSSSQGRSPCLRKETILGTPVGRGKRLLLYLLILLQPYQWKALRRGGRITVGRS